KKAVAREEPGLERGLFSWMKHYVGWENLKMSRFRTGARRPLCYEVFGRSRFLLSDAIELFIRHEINSPVCDRRAAVDLDGGACPAREKLRVQNLTRLRSRLQNAERGVHRPDIDLSVA